jgi:hypothetical protein
VCVAIGGHIGALGRYEASVKNMSQRRFLRAGVALLFSLVAVSHAGAQTCIQCPSDLANWWPGDGKASDIQDGKHGTLQNDPKFSV